MIHSSHQMLRSLHIEHVPSSIFPLPHFEVMMKNGWTALRLLGMIGSKTIAFKFCT